MQFDKIDPIPCPFLKFVHQFNDKDYDHLQYQLQANHQDNYIKVQDAKNKEKTKQSLGHKIAKIFKPSSPKEKKADEDMVDCF